MSSLSPLRFISGALLLAGSLAVCSADVITLPGTGPGNNNASPLPLTLANFGVLPQGLVETLSSSLFLSQVTGPIQITSIALRADPTNTATGPQTADLSLTANGTSVYNGSYTFQTANTGLFDMVVTFTTPFVYDPNGGDLALGVTLANVSEGSDILPDALIFIGQTVNNGIMTDIPDVFPGEPLVGSGLILQLNYTPVASSGVPEPSSFALMGSGLAAAAFYVRRRRAKQG